MIGVVDVTAISQLQAKPATVVPTLGVPTWAWMLGAVTVASVAVLMFVPPPRRWK